MESQIKDKKMAKQRIFPERLWRSSFPPAAVLGAFASFLTTAFRSRREARVDSPRDNSLVQINLSEKPTAAVSISDAMEMEYSQDLVLGDLTSTTPFRLSLMGVSVDSDDRIYVLGDGEIRIFGPGGNLIRSWRAPDNALCLTVGTDGRICFGTLGGVEIYDDKGVRTGGFPAGEGGKPANPTAIKIFNKEILVADASARYIRRYSPDGKQLGVIGMHGKNRGFMLPNRSLDMDVDAKGIVRATDPGRHRVSSWRLDGTPLGYFGKFGQANPRDFVGCCNPVNVAIAPDGKIVTGEKVIARVKVFDPQGVLLAVIGPEHFDPKCTRLHLAVDSNGRILVADPVRLKVKIFSTSSRSGGGINV
jgi:hypothetical protein